MWLLFLLKILLHKEGYSGKLHKYNKPKVNEREQFMLERIKQITWSVSVRRAAWSLIMMMSAYFFIIIHNRFDSVYEIAQHTNM